MRSHRSLLGLALSACLAAVSYAAGSLNDLTSRSINYGARALRVAYDFVVTPFLSLYRAAPDFEQTQQHSLNGAISKAMARSFVQRMQALTQRTAWASANMQPSL